MFAHLCERRCCPRPRPVKKPLRIGPRFFQRRSPSSHMVPSPGDSFPLLQRSELCFIFDLPNLSLSLFLLFHRGALILSTFLAGAHAYARTAQSVSGSVVKEAGNLTMGGMIGTYTVLLQVGGFRIGSNHVGPLNTLRGRHFISLSCTRKALDQKLQVALCVVLVTPRLTR